MINIEDVYLSFLRARGKFFNRGYRLPKNPKNSIEKIKTKNEKNYKNLKTITLWFNTKWQNIDIEEYFNCGFELYKSFSYYKFLDDNIIKLYIQKDKIKKYEDNINKKEILNSFKFIKNYNVKNNLKDLKEYCLVKDGYEPLIIKEYVKNNINLIVLMYCVLKKYLSLENQLLDIDNIIKYKQYTLNFWNFLQECENKIKEDKNG